MRSHLLAHYVQTLHLRKDAPMPSELRASHARVSSLRKCSGNAAGAAVLQFKRRTK